jgi:hypothetical protein
VLFLSLLSNFIVKIESCVRTQLAHSAVCYCIGPGEKKKQKRLTNRTAMQYDTLTQQYNTLKIEIQNVNTGIRPTRQLVTFQGSASLTTSGDARNFSRSSLALPKQMNQLVIERKTSNKPGAVSPIISLLGGQMNRFAYPLLDRPCPRPIASKPSPIHSHTNT